jgi:PIN domain nuclease of toxin-antitoxin system
MSDVLADTHTIVWSLFEPSRLSPTALSTLTAAAQGGRILISAITIVELNYLA